MSYACGRRAFDVVYSDGFVGSRTLRGLFSISTSRCDKDGWEDRPPKNIFVSQTTVDSIYLERTHAFSKDYELSSAAFSLTYRLTELSKLCESKLLLLFDVQYDFFKTCFTSYIDLLQSLALNPAFVYLLLKKND